MPRYRPNVAIILQNAEGEILLCERSDTKGCWQFPQGGLKKGETAEEGLAREVEEELGLKPKEYRVLARRGPYRYLFTNGKKKEGYDGQEQTYFLAELRREDAVFRFDHEFQDARWMRPAAYDLGWIAPMKKDVYRQVFADFFGVAFA